MWRTGNAVSPFKLTPGVSNADDRRRGGTQNYIRHTLPLGLSFDDRGPRSHFLQFSRWGTARAKLAGAPPSPVHPI